jgi:hypothetical protein
LEVEFGSKDDNAKLITARRRRRRHQSPRESLGIVSSALAPLTKAAAADEQAWPSRLFWIVV